MRLSLVIPTISRNTLARALSSVCCQAILPGDEVIVIGDGSQPKARALFDRCGLPGRYVETPRRLGAWGHGARNWMLANRIPRGELICSLDDDDTLEPNYFDTVRSVALAHRGAAFLLKIRFSGGVILWKNRELIDCNVGTAMFVYPNDGLFGRFGDDHTGDSKFISHSILLRGRQPVWREEVIYNVGC